MTGESVWQGGGGRGETCNGGWRRAVPDTHSSDETESPPAAADRTDWPAGAQKAGKARARPFGPPAVKGASSGAQLPDVSPCHQGLHLSETRPQGCVRRRERCGKNGSIDPLISVARPGLVTASHGAPREDGEGTSPAGMGVGLCPRSLLRARRLSLKLTGIFILLCNVTASDNSVRELELLPMSETDAPGQQARLSGWLRPAPDSALHPLRLSPQLEQEDTLTTHLPHSCKRKHRCAPLLTIINDN